MTSISKPSHEDKLKALDESLTSLSAVGYWRRRKPLQELEPVVWHWKDLRPCLDEAGELVQVDANSGSRTLQLINPVLKEAQRGTSRTLQVSMQLLKHGEASRAHRHMFPQPRFIVEASGAYTAVEGGNGELGFYLVNSLNPFRIEGQKTIVAEMLEQRAWQPPDFIVVPGGNLGSISAIGNGLLELKGLDFIEKVPRLVVVQAAGASPFYRTYSEGSPELLVVERPETEATAIRIGRPANWNKARRVLEWSQGFVECVTDQEIFEAKAVLAEDGIGCEPASAATVAGVRKLVRAGKIDRGADIVAVLTGNQLKDTEYIYRHRSVAESLEDRVPAEPDREKLRRLLLEKLFGVPA